MHIICRRHVNIGKKELGAIRQAIKAGAVVSGPHIKIFEQEFARYTGNRFALAVPSARAGIWAVFNALGASAGDEVIMSAYNFPPLISILKLAGLEPVLADIIPGTCSVDPVSVKKRVTKKSRFIFVTHLFGVPAEMEALCAIAREHHLTIIEDCAHACGAEYHGKKLGSFGVAGVFSFGIGKSPLAFGGGMITTDSEELYKNLSRVIQKFELPRRTAVLKKIFTGLAFWFFTSTRAFPFTLYPLAALMSLFDKDIESLLDGFSDVPVHTEEELIKKEKQFSNAQALIGLLQLEKTAQAIAQRTAVSEQLTKGLEQFSSLLPISAAKENRNSWLYFPITVPLPQQLKKHLIFRGIDIKISSQRDCSGGACPYAAAIDRKVVKLPNYPLMGEKKAAYIIKEVACFMKGHNA